jgi:DNA-binding SARP family transcriptional activator
METAAVVRVQLNGGFRVELPNGRVAGPWERPSARRLFQVVVSRDRRRIGREELAELLFPDLAPERAANAVSKALTMARSALSPFPVVQADRDVIWIDGAIEVDADAIRSALRFALSQPPGDARDAGLVSALCDRGRLLDDELYADWAAAAREALEGLRADGSIALARDRSAGHGRSSAHSVVDAWSDVLALDRSNEEACSVLMATYADLGQPDQVVRTYHRTVAALHQLGLDPSEALGTRYAAAVETAGTARRSASTAPSLRTTFGRDATLGGLLEAVTRPNRGSARTVLVTGPPGIGKSHAVDALRRDLLAAGWTVAHAAGVPGDSRAPLRALRVLLHQLHHETARGLVCRLASDGESPEFEGDNARAALVSEVRLALDHQAERGPFAIMLDDVQWMDRGLQAILTDLINASSNRRWAVVLAARSGDDDMTVAPPPATRRFELAPLAVDATEGLVRHTSPRLSDRAVRRVAARSGGNPFFAIELARQGTSVPDGTPATPPPFPS